MNLPAGRVMRNRYQRNVRQKIPHPEKRERKPEYMADRRDQNVLHIVRIYLQNRNLITEFQIRKAAGTGSHGRMMSASQMSRGDRLPAIRNHGSRENREPGNNIPGIRMNRIAINGTLKRNFR